MLSHLDHVIVGVTDLAEATRILTALLGRAPSWRGEHPGLGTTNALFRLRNTSIELLSPNAAAGGRWGDRLRDDLSRDGDGLLALSFRTDDVVACVETLRGRGVSASEPQSREGLDLDTGVTRRWRSVQIPSEAARGLLVFAIQHEDPEDALPLAQAPKSEDGDESGAVSALDHVVVASGDAEASRAFYGDQLGLRLALDRTFDERRLRLLFFPVGGVTVEIARPLDAAPQHRDRFLGLSYQVPDVDRARARIAAAGFDVSTVRGGMKPGTRVCTVRGKPLGVDTLLIQPSDGTRPAVR